MELTRKIQGNGFYVFEGICCANTHFVENKRESDQFIRFLDRYLEKYLSVYEFAINKNGWTIVVRTKSETTVRKHYLRQRKKRNKEGGIELFNIWDIISNAIRLMRSHFTKWTNQQRNRTGNASKFVFRRYMFSCLEEAKTYIHKVRNQEVKMEQINPRYWVNSEHYDEDGQIAANKEQLSSKAYHEGNLGSRFQQMRSLKIMEYVGEKLERWLKKTCEKHGAVYGKGETRNSE